MTTTIYTNWMGDPACDSIGGGDYQSLGTVVLSQEATIIRESAHALKVVATGTNGGTTLGGNNLVASGAGQVWTFTVYARGAGTAQIGWAGLNSGFSNIAAPAYATGVALSGSDWTRLTVTFTTAALTAWVRMLVRNTASDPTYYLADFMMEKAATASRFFHGDFVDTVIDTYDWVGTPNASASTRTEVIVSPATSERTFTVRNNALLRQ